MTDYLSYKFEDNQQFIETYDELPLWSAPFGLLLLKQLQLKPDITVIDIGSGTGFPLIELAGRLGRSCKLYGLDPWKTANNRAKLKIKNYGLSNVEIIEGSGELIPFPENSVDLIISNLGINNFDKPDIVFKECKRVLKVNAKLAITTNLNGHWSAFYHVFEETLKQLGREDLVVRLDEEQKRRGSVDSVIKRFTDNGFNQCRLVEETFEMKFLDGSAFLNHHFVKLGWLPGWKELLPQNEWKQIFRMLEGNLNKHAGKFDGLTLAVPMAFIEGEKGVNP